MSTTATLRQPSLGNLVAKDYGRPPEKQHTVLQDLIQPHVASFNYMLREGLSAAVQDIPPVEFQLHNGDKVSFAILDTSFTNPTVAEGNRFITNPRLYPAECREGRKTYKSHLQTILVWKLNGEVKGHIERVLGDVPIMVKSEVCNLHGLSPTELVRRGEEEQEMGGYFIVNGIERVIRMLIMQRRNVPICLSRSSWKKRGSLYSQYGVVMRCVKHDQTSCSHVLHYLTNGSAMLGFNYRKEQFFVPVIFLLKGLLNVSDKYIYDQLLKGCEDDTTFKGCVTYMLRQVQNIHLISQTEILQYIGKRFRIKLKLALWYTDVQVAQYLLQRCVCIHLTSNLDKFNLLVHMTQKLFALAHGKCASENLDSPMNQEVLLPGHYYNMFLKVSNTGPLGLLLQHVPQSKQLSGHYYNMFLKERIEVWLQNLRLVIERNAKTTGTDYRLTEVTLNRAMRSAGNIGKATEYMLATGNLISPTGLGLMQAAGLTVVADKLNYLRYLSHFRCVHRGAFFAGMRTTEVRKLLPEAWGFLCPVHTPDGTPCGLMNHLSAMCQVVCTQYLTGHLPKLLVSLGVSPLDAPPPGPIMNCYTVMLDGRIIGYVTDDYAQEFTDKLRYLKVKNLNKVPPILEICLVKKTKFASPYPGIFLFTQQARMMRPVRNLALNMVEMVGTFEQVYLNICVSQSEAVAGVTTHHEISKASMLSLVASLVPYSDHNQSPRNMYQCQMGKQTMGMPLHALSHRADNKLYSLVTPQSPIVRPYSYDSYLMDNYPLGTNAIVAVISYTGYDMEDAMVINKASLERGFSHGRIFKSEVIDLMENARERGKVTQVFGSKAGSIPTNGFIDADGLPFIGTYLQEGDPYYSYINIQTGEVFVKKYKDSEPAYVEQVKVLGSDIGTAELHKVCIVLRVPRNPIIGDKFASRHGQKGICSIKWPAENMPFSEGGLTPDIIFNPHGFPSRMTIGMMIESMAGKSAAMHGLCHDATPFTFSEHSTAIDYFGNMLTAAGYNYYGTERMYSGIDGREFEVDIFFGVVYYQRLRHMVSDKFQVRTTGPVDSVTHQPVKGRKKGGGVRFGEMERDALIAHGTAFLLQDRLMNCSDKCIAHVCSKCGSILSPMHDRPTSAFAAASSEAVTRWTCLTCETSEHIGKIVIPYVFRYLIAELAAMNIKVELKVK